ncbi:MAG: NAD-dependent epimerase/dehydratase family protein, partial [Arenicellales bacterium]
MATYVVTGGAGFIGSAMIRMLIEHPEHRVVNVDKLTYAGNLETLRSVEGDPRYVFI